MFSSSGGHGLDFTSNSDGNHWLWRHDDGSSDPIVYGAHLNVRNGEVWRLRNITTSTDLVSVTDEADLRVAGTVTSGEVVVTETGWADFVFEEGYDLPLLEEVKTYIEHEGHLPDIPSAKEVEREGVALGKMNAKLLQKIEELTLYAIKRQEEAEKLGEAMQTLRHGKKKLNREIEALQHQYKG